MRGMPPLQETLASIKLYSCRLHVRKWSHYRDSGYRRILRIGLVNLCRIVLASAPSHSAAEIREGRSRELHSTFTFRRKVECNNSNKILNSS